MNARELAENLGQTALYEIFRGAKADADAQLRPGEIAPRAFARFENPPGKTERGLLAAMLAITALAARSLGFSRGDRIAIMFCGSKKSLVTGISMANVLFAGHTLGLIVLPLMIFHQMQLMACAALARHYARTALPASPRAAQLQTFTVEAR